MQAPSLSPPTNIQLQVSEEDEQMAYLNSPTHFHEICYPVSDFTGLMVN